MNNIKNNCIITGIFAGNEDILPMCADIFQKRGGEIAAVYTGNGNTKQWAEQAGIYCIDEDSTNISRLYEMNFDYLFSITDNKYPVCETIRKAGKASIKLNLGILPEYAGANTSFWVLNNGEFKHGVTWHLIDGDLESEDIIKQDIFYVQAGDTAGSLLKKCYDAAAQSFNSLVDDIFDGGITKIKQDLSRRVYTSKYQKPLLAGIINWDQPAEKILRLISNLNHGNYINYLTLPKIRIENDIYIIEKLGLTGQSSEHRGGSVINVSDDGIVISTQTNNVILHKVCNYSGKPVSINYICEKYNIVPGFRFQYLSNNCINQLLEYDLEINKNEEYWVGQLYNIKANDTRLEEEKINTFETVSIHPEYVISKEFIKKSGLPESSIVRALFILYILKKIGKTELTIGLCNYTATEKINCYVNLLSQIVPVNINSESNEKLSLFINEIDNKFRIAFSKKTFYNDVFVRYPGLKSLCRQNLYPAAIAQVDNIENYKDIEDVPITFITTDGNKYYLNFDSAGYTGQEIELRIKDFYRFIQDVIASDEEQNTVTEKQSAGYTSNLFPGIVDEYPLAYETKVSEREVIENKKVVFMFPWEGMIFQNTAAELYSKEPAFRNEVDKCFNILKSKYNLDIKQYIFSGKEEGRPKKNTDSNPLLILLSTFIIEYSLAKFWMALGVKPSAMIGHSTGEYTAASLAGVFNLEDIFRILIAQSRMLSALPPGEMLSIAKNQMEVSDYLQNDISLAAVNGNELCILSGDKNSIDSLSDACKAKKIEAYRLSLKYPEHSRLLEPLLYDYKYELKNIQLNKPDIPFISSITGDWIKDKEALDFNYWAEQPAKTVKFETGISRLLSDTENIFLEIGPGRSLVYLLSLHNSNKIISSPSLRCAGEKISDVESVNRAIYFLEKNNIKINFFNYESRRFYFTGKEIITNRTIRCSENENPYEVLNETQLYIADLWREMLEIEAVNTDDDFINLGGNSLLLIRSINAINRYFNVNLPLKRVFREPTIKNIEQLIFKEENKNMPGQIFIKPAVRNLFINKAFAAN